MYMNKTHLLSLQFKPEPSKGLECYADPDFAGTYIHDFAAMDPGIVKSCSGWYISMMDASSFGPPSCKL